MDTTFPRVKRIAQGAFQATPLIVSVASGQPYSFTIFSNCKYIGGAAFPQTSLAIEAIIDTKKIKSIGDFAFEGCYIGNTSESISDENIVSISLPKCKYIGEGALTVKNAVRLSLYLPKLKKIGISTMRIADDGTTTMEEIYAPKMHTKYVLGSTPSIITQAEAMEYNTMYTSKLNIGTLHDPNLSSHLDGLYGVRMPTSTTYTSKPYLTDLTIDNFRGPIYSNISYSRLSQIYPNLVSLRMNKCSYIDSSAFRAMPKLEYAEFNNVREIGSYAFYSCSKLTEIQAERCEVVGSYAFYYCRSLTEINFERCHCIHNDAVEHCSNTLNISMPNLLSISNSGMYYTAYKIDNLYIPNIIHIGSWRFGICCRIHHRN